MSLFFDKVLFCNIIFLNPNYCILMCLPIYLISSNGSKKSKFYNKFETIKKNFKQPKKLLSIRFVLSSSNDTKDEEISLINSLANDFKSGYVTSEERNKSFEALIKDISLNSEGIKHILSDTGPTPHVIAKDILLRRCGQTEILPFEECYPSFFLKNCHKIGEGVYGEVFLFRNQEGSTSVMKIIPIEGDQMVNGEKQKKFEEILSEIIIAEELSKLRTTNKNATSTFCEVRNIKCVQGKYPERLIDLWELYEEDCGSQNDSPAIFNEQQLYVILELANGGKDLEAFVFNDALQALSVFKQTVCALAVAENALQFEHRDLHWGNVLITKVDDRKSALYNLNGLEIIVPTEGVEVSLIDFTMSRITYSGICIYNDLALDPQLFNAKGDYQFDIYKLMQKANGNEWQQFEPHTNILWLHYLLDKMINGLRYKMIMTKAHQTCLEELKLLKEEILNYRSVSEFVESKYI